MNGALHGRVWCVGDDVNTDLILPNDMLTLPRTQRAQSVFRANRPGWAAQVRQGDILVAGRNFGMGSGRPASLALKDLGIACVLADSINALFFRNCVNDALPALDLPGARAAFAEGDEAEIDFDRATATCLRTGRRLSGTPWPPMLLASLRAGGLIQRLEAEGLIQPAAWSPGTGDA